MTDNLKLLPIGVPEGESDSISSAIAFEAPLLEGEVKDIPTFEGEFDLQKLAETANPLSTSHTWNTETGPEAIANDIITFFTDAEVRKGDVQHMEDSRPEFVPMLSKKIAANEQLEFILLGMPHRIPNPIKTSRPAPDFGEFAALIRLAQFMRALKERYEPGAKLVLVAEGTAFSGMFGISDEEIQLYRDTIAQWIEEYGFSDVLELVDLKDVMEGTPGYTEARDRIEQEVRDAYAADDEDIKAVFAKTVPTIFFSFNVREYPIQLLREIYAIDTEDVSEEALKIRNDLWKKAHEATFPYLALHKARREVLTERHHYPDAVPLTVTPKKGRLGIHTVNAQTILLPHHGNCVVNMKDKSMTVQYEFDILRTGGVSKVMLPNDEYPFAYVRNEDA